MVYRYRMDFFWRDYRHYRRQWVADGNEAGNIQLYGNDWIFDEELLRRGLADSCGMGELHRRRKRL